MAVVQPQGSLNASNAQDFQAALLERIQGEAALGLLVDMSHLESLDSSGLISLIAAFKQARLLGKQFYLCSVPPAIRIVFELTQLDQAFEILDEGSTSFLAAA
ncbi:MAG: STAS domain-containing protein [Cyanobacteria bacterium REEB459]|nr:STAS domain-containing protein [Cyanobacteria bacterium REEB459]